MRLSPPATYRAWPFRLAAPRSARPQMIFSCGDAMIAAADGEVAAGGVDVRWLGLRVEVN